jgi:large subunit ribosomal protein L31e
MAVEENSEKAAGKEAEVKKEKLSEKEEGMKEDVNKKPSEKEGKKEPIEEKPDKKIPSAKKEKMAKKKISKEPEKTVVKTGKIYTIPLRKAFRKSDRKRTRYATSLIREYLKRHAKTTEIKIGENLNNAVNAKGRKHPPRRVRVHVFKDAGVARAELVGYEYKEFMVMPKEEPKGMAEKLQERLGPKALKKQEEEKKVEGKEHKNVSSA